MKRDFHSILHLKSMFSKLIASFILIIILISSFHVVTNYIYTRNMENEIGKSVNSMFHSVVDEFELYFSQIKDKLLMDFYIEYFDSFASTRTHDYQNWLMIRSMSKYLLLHKNVQDFIVLQKEFNYVITLNGTFEAKTYFEHICDNKNYTQSFWLDEMKKDFMYMIYPADKFVIADSLEKYKLQYLMPIVLKNTNAANFILIVLVDVNKFTNDLDPDFINDFYIFNEDKELLYPLQNAANEELILEIKQRNETSGNWNYKNGYIFADKSPESSLLYYKYYPNTIVKKQITEINRLLSLIILLSMLISILLSIYIVRKFNNPVKQIYQLIKQSKATSNGDRDIIDLAIIKESIKGIISNNMNYMKDINEKNSMLKSYFYQDRLKNILSVNTEPNRSSTETIKFAVVLFKIHYKASFYENDISQISGKGSEMLKDLIHIYLCELFTDAVTFLMEHDQVVSIASVQKDIESIEEAVTITVQKLKSEDEYVYFTVIYSKVYSNSSDLHEAYIKTVEMLKYRKFIDKTQVMSENTVSKKMEGFYFSEEQQTKFMNLLKNGKKAECIQHINKVFENNLKKEINEFCIYLLYVQIIDCCSNVLMHFFNKIPEELPEINTCFNFGQCGLLEEYIKRYRCVITECMDYINDNQKQSDYIIDYVKNYINVNYENDITVDLLAEKLKISRTYLSKYFKNSTGMNLSDYLNMFRMNKACALLQNSYLMVKDIAPRVGIFSISTFMRLFKNHTGKTPNDYRKSFL